MCVLSKFELLEKANYWLEEIEKQDEYVRVFSNAMPTYYALFCKEWQYKIDVNCEKRHLERLKRIYNKIINQLQTKNY